MAGCKRQHSTDVPTAKRADYRPERVAVNGIAAASNARGRDSFIGYGWGRAQRAPSYELSWGLGQNLHPSHPIHRFRKRSNLAAYRGMPAFWRNVLERRAEKPRSDKGAIIESY